MKHAAFPLLIVLASCLAVFAVVRDTPADEAGVVQLALSTHEAQEVTPYLQAAALELGEHRVRAYGKGVFINGDNATIAYVQTNGALQMHYAFESKYRVAHAQRESELKALRSHGEAIVARAQEIRARQALDGAIATNGAVRPHSGG